MGINTLLGGGYLLLRVLVLTLILENLLTLFYD